MESEDVESLLILIQLDSTPPVILQPIVWKAYTTCRVSPAPSGSDSMKGLALKCEMSLCLVPDRILGKCIFQRRIIIVSALGKGIMIRHASSKEEMNALHPKFIEETSQILSCSRYCSSKPSPIIKIQGPPSITLPPIPLSSTNDLIS